MTFMILYFCGLKVETYCSSFVCLTPTVWSQLRCSEHITQLSKRDFGQLSHELFKKIGEKLTEKIFQSF